MSTTTIDRVNAADALLGRWFGGEDVPAEELAGLVFDLDKSSVRDLAWLWIDGDPGRGHALTRALLYITDTDPAVWFLAAYAAWKLGFHGQTAEAIAGCLRADPTYSAVQLLATAITFDADPGQFGFSADMRDLIFAEARQSQA